MRRRPKAILKTEYFPIQGGEDLVAPSLSVKPGRAKLTSNYECDLQGRLRLIDGYEAFDGRPKPSDASYWILNFDAGTTEIEVGDTVDGAGGASGEALVVVVESGTWAGNDAAGYLVLFNVSGDYVDDETLSVSAVASATANGTQLETAASTNALHVTYLLAAIEATREDIGAVTGSGSILGVHQYNGVKYAFRNNAAGTATKMFKSSTSGWTECDLGRTIAFTSGGTYEISEDDTITGATSGATATVKRIILTSGTWAGGDAAGTLVLYSQSGNLEAENLDVGANSNVATIAGDSTATTLPADGRYEFVNHNFGATGSRRMYGVNGVGKGFEWDGSVFVPITTGMATDTPVHVIAHKNHLFFAFPGGSSQHSSTGNPYEWSVVTGASEMGVGDEITGYLSMPNVLAIFSRNSTHLLYGTGVTDWELSTHSVESGAIEWTCQKIGPGVYLDDRGITSLSATDRYGDFKANVLSKYIDPYLKTVIGSAQCAIRVKEKNQYRLFLNNKDVVTLTMDGGKIIGFTRQQYEDQVVCACSSENSSGEEELFFGCDDGYVYQLDSGTSFNGEPIVGIVRLHFNHLKSPDVIKRIRRINLELTASIDTYLKGNVEFDFGGSESGETFFDVDIDGGVLGVDSWGSFVWNGVDVSSAPMDVDGSGRNFALIIYHSGEWPSGSVYSGITNAVPHTIQGYTIHYSIRKVQR